MTNLQAIDLLKGLEQSLDDYCELNDEGKTAFGMAITALELFGISEQLPPAEPKRGKWIDTRGNAEWYAREYECSECGDTMLGEANFCPNCGADMRQKGENSESD